MKLLVLSRLAPLVLAATWLTGALACSVETSFAGTSYACEEGACPSGYQCVEARCVSAGAGGDDSDPDPPSDELALIRIAAGDFLRGCVDASLGCELDEGPVTTVQLDAFDLTRTEVTQAAYAKCVDDDACERPRCAFDPDGEPDLPVACVGWEDASDFCEWAGLRLPSEAEWERAARGATGRVFPWGNAPADCDHAHTEECGNDRRRVATLPGDTTPEGVVDLAGNVSEWVLDWYNATYYATGPTSNPRGPDDGVSGVTRGGSIDGAASEARASNRTAMSDDDHDQSRGFRCAKDAAHP